MNSMINKLISDDYKGESLDNSMCDFEIEIEEEKHLGTEEAMVR